MVKFFKLYDSFIEKTICILLGILVVSLFTQVVSRHFLNISIMWTDELGRYLFIWIVYLGSAVAFRERSHLVVDVFTERMPYKLQFFLKSFFNLLILAFLFLVFIFGLKFSMINMANPAYSMRIIKLGIVYASIPVGALLMIVNILRVIHEDFKIKRKGGI